MMTFFFELKLRCALFLMLCNSSCRSVRNASKRQHFFSIAARKKKYLFHSVYIFDASKNFDLIFFLLLSHKYICYQAVLYYFSMDILDAIKNYFEQKSSIKNRFTQKKSKKKEHEAQVQNMNLSDMK